MPAPEPPATTGLPVPLWNQFLDVGHRRRYRRGDVVFVEGDPPGDVFGIVEGRVKLSALTREGRELAVGYKSVGELFGELAAIDGLDRSATATAVADLAVAAVPASAFLELVDRNPEFARPLLEMLADRLRAATSHQVDLRTGTTVERVASGLVDLADRKGVALDGRPAMTLRQDDLAAWVGVNREAVSRALARLRELGLVATGRGRVELLDLTALRRIHD